MCLYPPRYLDDTMIISIFPVLMRGILVFPLVRSSPVLVAESNLGCQCSSEASTKVGERREVM